MKKISLYILLLIPFVCMYGAKNDRDTVLLACDLHCQGCCDKIMKHIAFEKGVRDLECDLRSKTVTVIYDKRKTDTEHLLTAFARIGKPAKIIKKRNEK